MDYEKIKKDIKKNGFTIREFCTEIGYSQAGFNKAVLESSFNMKALQKMSEVLKVSILEFFDKSDIKTSVTSGIPYYDIDAAGGNLSLFQDLDGAEFLSGYINIPGFEDCQLAVNVTGDSMHPKYSPGDIILCKKVFDYDVLPLGEAYLVVTKEHRLVKYIHTCKDTTKLNFVSENEKYPNFYIEKKKILHLFLIKGKIQKNII